MTKFYRKDLFEEIKISTLFTDLVSKVSSQSHSKNGNIYEKTWDMIIKFGLLPILSNDNYEHYDGNINTCKLKKINNLETYLENKLVFSKGKGGSSDITLQEKVSKKWVFISSKFYSNDDTKTIKDYDIQDILAVINENTHKYKSYKIMLLVNNKEKVSRIISSCQDTNSYIKDNIGTILDINDLEYYFQILKSSIINLNFNQINSVFCNEKTSLQLRFHQTLTVEKTFLKIRNNEKEFLFGMKCRSGKTYIIGGLLSKYYTENNKLNALIITPAPTETISQFTDDLFHKFRDFKDINIIEIKSGEQLLNITLLENNIIIVSKQLLDDYINENTVNIIKNLEIDFFISDENHFHGTTDKCRDIITSYCSNITIKIYLTATYSKSLRTWNIKPECQFFWTTEDENDCKDRNILKLIGNHGDIINSYLNENNKEKILKEYDTMPKIEMITNMMDSERYKAIKENIKDTSYGFSNTTLLSLNTDETQFNFIGEVDKVLRYISGSHKEIDYPNGDNSIFGRIKNKSSSHNSRTNLNNIDFTTQLWFLPFGKGMHIEKVSECLRSRMLGNIILNRFDIMIINSKKDYKLKDIKQEIYNRELKAKEEGKDGLILLAGNQCTLGITLPFVDIIFLLNDILSSDKILQMMYRCMTEKVENEVNLINNGLKKFGFVVDMNISRILNTFSDFKIYKKCNSEQKIRYIIENNLINIDSETFQSKENKTELIEKLIEIWKSDPINILKTQLKQIENNIIELDSIDQRKLNSYFTSSIGDKKLNVKIKMDEENEEQLQTGRSITTPIAGETKTEQDNKILNISLSKDVLPFILPFSIFLTIKNNSYDFNEILNTVKTNPELLEIFNDQCFIWWNHSDIIDMCINIVNKYISKDSSIYDTVIQIKMSLESLIDNPKLILEFINTCLKPKQKEKQENGEVFTPVHIIDDMLNNLDTHYTKENNKSIFTELNFKWFDPASGMGNFPIIIYLRLMEGLKTQIEDDQERKRHILENMLYMSEFNKKNVFICKQIFDIKNEYNLNLHEGDTLLLNILEKWGIEKFDVVLGNPPYNKGGIRSHTGKKLNKNGEKSETIWPIFVKKSFEWLKQDGFLVFITPLSWLKKSHSLHLDMLEKYVIYLTVWDNSKSKEMINADIPISIYIIQNILNTPTFNKETIIISELKRRKLKTNSITYLNPNYSIPLAYHSIFNKLITFIEENNLQLEYKNKSIKSSENKTFIPLEYTIEDMWAVHTYTIKEGIMVKKITDIHPDMSKRKLIISNKSSFRGVFIDEGKLGITGMNYYIIGYNLELIKKILGFNISNIISHFTKYGQDLLSNECFSYIPDLRKMNIIDIDENDFYTLIGLSEEEIHQINNTLTGCETRGTYDREVLTECPISSEGTSRVVNVKDKDISDTESIKSEQKSNRKKTKNVVENKGENDINKLTVPKLKELAKSRNIKIHSKIKKQELISLLNLY